MFQWLIGVNTRSFFRPFVNLGFGTLALELELILQTLLFPVP